MQTVLNGTDWDYTATDKEKYETIKEAIHILYAKQHIKRLNLLKNGSFAMKPP